MKKTSFVVADFKRSALTAKIKKPLSVAALSFSILALSGPLLSGCGAFRSSKSWKAAQQESPLEIPPGLDIPATSEALLIPPPGANRPTPNGATSAFGQGGGVIADGFVLNDTVDEAYRRIGEIVADGSLGDMTMHDDVAHSYTLNVKNTVPEERRGFFARLFGGHKSGDDQSGDSPSASMAQPLTITIHSSGSKASEVRAQGNAAGVAKVIDTLKSRLGIDSK